MNQWNFLISKNVYYIPNTVIKAGFIKLLHTNMEQLIARYMMNALDLFFYKLFEILSIKKHLQHAFYWYLGTPFKSYYVQLITGGCYLFRKENVNLNQGAESTVCYLSARLAETYISKKEI
jgi:hypothetical protein